ncbi:hypothetical protein D9757_006951 [Collybiopsis confluens]|uniref:Uncharacterized protein n=1 Tax=Collybiopsis confluens TaxID=2823264 RepID=A0A8H5HIL5_9AGAR|nr:hypothetical protein D9757_006951 [Collybiopsis confluens]
MTTPAINLTLCSPRPSAKSSSGPVVVSSPVPSQSQLEKGQIVVRVDRFGWSANNVTYQALGEHPHFRYYDFHSVPSNSGHVSPATHGLVPVWGFGTVVTSAHPKVFTGERLYGYFAPARYVVLPIDEKDVNKYSMYIPRPHLPADRRVYNQIQRCSTDPLYTPETEDLSMLYKPLFWTSYWCEDWLARSGYRGGCEYILISSASSKTAFCFAYCVRNRLEAQAGGSAGGSNDLNALRIIGLTSKANLEFTKNLGLYDQVYEYDSFLCAPSSSPFHTRDTSGANTNTPRWIYIDVAGNFALNSKIYTHFASPYVFPTLIASISLGMTNLAPGEKGAQSIDWSTSTGSSASTNPSSSSSLSFKNSDSRSDSQQHQHSLGFWPRAEHFFTPEWLAVRRTQLSPTEMFEMQKRAWDGLMRDCTAWVDLEYVRGGEKVRKVYEDVLGGRRGISPDKGWIWSMWDEGDVEDNVGTPRAKL